jgi:hypothetical protein
VGRACDARTREHAAAAVEDRQRAHVERRREDEPCAELDVAEADRDARRAFESGVLG